MISPQDEASIQAIIQRLIHAKQAFADLAAESADLMLQGLAIPEHLEARRRKLRVEALNLRQDVRDLSNRLQGTQPDLAIPDYLPEL